MLLANHVQCAAVIEMTVATHAFKRRNYAKLTVRNLFITQDTSGGLVTYISIIKP